MLQNTRGYRLVAIFFVFFLKKIFQFEKSGLFLQYQIQQHKMTHQPFNSTFQVDILNLHWNDKSKTLSEEASSLGIGSWTKHISVNNHRTKNSRIFSLVKKHTDGEGEVTHVEYAPDANEMKMYPDVAGLKLLIWND